MAACLLGLCACSPAHPDPSPESWFQEASGALRERRYQDALQKAETALESLPSANQEPNQARWRWRFRLLKAEILLWMDVRYITALPAENDSEIAALLAGPAPTQELELRQLLLKGLQAVSEGNAHLAEDFYRQVHNRARHLDDWNLLTEAEYHLASIETDPAARLDIYLPAAQRPQEQVDPFHLARSSINVHVIYSGRNSWRLARDWAERALEASQRSGVKRLEAISLLNLGTAQNRLGYFGAAAKNLEQAGALVNQLPAEQGLWSPIFLELGNNQFFQSNWKEALHQFEEAARREGDSKRKALYNRFVAWAELENCTEAKEARAEYSRIDRGAKEGMPVSADVWRDKLNDGRLHHICGRNPAARESYRQVLDGAGEYPWLSLRAFTGLGMIDAEDGDWTKAQGHFEAAMRLVRAADDALSRTEDRMAVFSALNESYREYVHWLIRHDDHERALVVADSGRGALLREVLAQSDAFEGSMRQFRELARRSSQAFLFYWIAKRDSYAWVLKGDLFEAIQLDIDRGRLLDGIRRYQQGIIRRQEEPGRMLDRSGFELSKALIRPVEELLRGSEVVLILDDELQGLNLEALPVGEPGNWHYWIEDVTISVAPSLGQLATNWRRPAPPSRRPDFLLIGSPVYQDPNQDLGGAKREVDKVRHHLSSDFQVWEKVESDAHPAAVLQMLKELPSARGVHFAAHAEAVSLQPFESAFLLTPLKERHRLYAYEILDIGPRRGLDLAVLSACQSAGENTYSGQGPVGLAWAFMSLGSCNVVASLWDADDEATADLMDAFYSGWKEGLPYAKALQQAKLHLIHEKGWRKPAFWGAFQHYLGCRPQ